MVAASNVVFITDIIILIGLFVFALIEIGIQIARFLKDLKSQAEFNKPISADVEPNSKLELNETALKRGTTPMTMSKLSGSLSNLDLSQEMN